MHYILISIDFHAPGAKKALADLQEKVCQFFYAFDEFEPPMLINAPGLEKVVGFTYVPRQRPPGIFCGKPYLELDADCIKIRKLTKVPVISRTKFLESVENVREQHPDVFPMPTPYKFGPATPEVVRRALLENPDLVDAINRTISDMFGGMPVDEKGQYDPELHSRIQSVVNDPAEDPPGLLSFREFEAIVAQGRL